MKTQVKPDICMGCFSDEEVVLASGGFTSYTPYWYCRTCKSEIDTSGYPDLPFKFTPYDFLSEGELSDWDPENTLNIFNNIVI